MNTVLGRYVLCAMLTAAAAAPAIAQDGPPPPPGPGMGRGPDGPFMDDMGRHRAPVTGLPYSAATVTEMTQTLADGNRISRKTEGRVVRDSAGRTRREHTLTGLGPMPAGPEGSGNGRTVVMIDDPVAKTRYVLDPERKVARQMPAFSPRGGGPGPGFKRGTGAGPAGCRGRETQAPRRVPWDEDHRGSRGPGHAPHDDHPGRPDRERSAYRDRDRTVVRARPAGGRGADHLRPTRGRSVVPIDQHHTRRTGSGQFPGATGLQGGARCSSRGRQTPAFPGRRTVTVLSSGCGATPSRHTPSSRPGADVDGSGHTAHGTRARAHCPRHTAHRPGLTAHGSKHTAHRPGLAPSVRTSRTLCTLRPHLPHLPSAPSVRTFLGPSLCTP